MHVSRLEKREERRGGDGGACCRRCHHRRGSIDALHRGSSGKKGRGGAGAQYAVEHGGEGTLRPWRCLSRSLPIATWKEVRHHGSTRNKRWAHQGGREAALATRRRARRPRTEWSKSLRSCGVLGTLFLAVEEVEAPINACALTAQFTFIFVLFSSVLRFRSRTAGVLSACAQVVVRRVVVVLGGESNAQRSEFNRRGPVGPHNATGALASLVQQSEDVESRILSASWRYFFFFLRANSSRMRLCSLS